MRTWSIKTVVATLSVTIILAASAPRAEARPSQPSHTGASATQRFTRAVNQLAKRFFGIVSNALPTDPIPVQITDPNTTTTTTTTASAPKRQR